MHCVLLYIMGAPKNTTSWSMLRNNTANCWHGVCIKIDLGLSIKIKYQCPSTHITGINKSYKSVTEMACMSMCDIRQNTSVHNHKVPSSTSHRISNSAPPLRVRDRDCPTIGMGTFPNCFKFCISDYTL